MRFWKFASASLDGPNLLIEFWWIKKTRPALWPGPKDDALFWVVCVPGSAGRNLCYSPCQPTAMQLKVSPIPPHNFQHPPCVPSVNFVYALALGPIDCFGEILQWWGRWLGDINYVASWLKRGQMQIRFANTNRMKCK